MTAAVVIVVVHDVDVVVADVDDVVRDLNRNVFMALKTAKTLEEIRQICQIGAPYKRVGSLCC